MARRAGRAFAVEMGTELSDDLAGDFVLSNAFGCLRRVHGLSSRSAPSTVQPLVAHGSVDIGSDEVIPAVHGAVAAR